MCSESLLMLCRNSAVALYCRGPRCPPSHREDVEHKIELVFKKNVLIHFSHSFFVQKVFMRRKYGGVFLC